MIAVNNLLVAFINGFIPILCLNMGAASKSGCHAYTSDVDAQPYVIVSNQQPVGLKLL